jgi:hypothetical protein
MWSDNSPRVGGRGRVIQAPECRMWSDNPPRVGCVGELSELLSVVCGQITLPEEGVRESYHSS